jgi:starch-binding outer membrane protein, SusD/RagB family
MKYNLKGLVLCGALAGAAACSADRLEIPNYNNPTTEGVAGDPQGMQLYATGLIERQRSLQPGTSQDFGFLGRESYVYFSTDTRNVTGFLVGVPGPGPGGKTIDPGGFGTTNTNWLSRFNNMRNAVNLMKLVDASELTDAEKKAASGFAKTIRGLDVMWVLFSRDTLGMPVDISDDPNVVAPFVSKDSAYKFSTGMLEQGKTDLLAGGSTFPFTLSKGSAGFNTPATFLKFNRAILARVLVNRGTQGCGAPCFTQALTAIGESFATAPGAATSLDQLNAGVYNNYSTATGDVQNSLSSANNGNLFAHASIVTDAQKQADNTTLDDRVGRKVVKLANPVSPPQGTGIPATYRFSIYPTASSDVPVIRNEELILLRAEANIQLNNLAAALVDINTIRTVSGKLSALPSLGTQAAAITELLYNRRYSLLLEGQRWNDARRYNILNTLPLDNTSGQYTHFVARAQPVPLTECDARPAPKPQGCP